MLRQRGSSLGEQMIMLALAALFVAVAAAAFSYSLARGFALLGIALATAVTIFTLGALRDRRMERRREERCRSALEEAAVAQQAQVDTVFTGQTPGGPAFFGIAGAARKLFYARDGGAGAAVTVLDLDEVSAAFARPDGESRYRLEVRARTADARAPVDPVYLTVAGRDEAQRWVDALAPYLGTRAKLVDRNG